MKSHLKKIFFFCFHLIETDAQRKWKLDIRHFILQKKIHIKKTSFSAILTKSKSVAFSLLFRIDGHLVVSRSPNRLFIRHRAYEYISILAMPMDINYDRNRQKRT